MLEGILWVTFAGIIVICMNATTLLHQAYLLLGSNEGDRHLWLSKAREQITDMCGSITQQSSIYETGAWGITDQPDFLNQVILVETALHPLTLLHAIQQIEKALGRQRDVKWGPRTLDIDILFYDDIVLNAPALIIPHPYLQDRRFTLAPLAEIAPELMHPVLHQTVIQLLQACPDKLAANRLP